jgi:hypothetical protein
MSAMACSAVEKTLATLYYIVEVKKVREPVESSRWVGGWG